MNKTRISTFTATVAAVAMATALTGCNSNPPRATACSLPEGPDLDQAIAACGFCGRVVIGSWYGQKKVELNLGGRFHRSRIRLASSQVSTIDPRWTGRWDKNRRMQAALRMIEELRPSSLITHRFSLDRAAEAYRLLDRTPQEAIQIVLTYHDQP